MRSRANISPACAIAKDCRITILLEGITSRINLRIERLLDCGGKFKYSSEPDPHRYLLEIHGEKLPRLWMLQRTATRLNPLLPMRSSPVVTFPVTLLLLVHAAFAAEPPGAGSQIRQLPTTPVAPQRRPDLRIEPAAAGAAPALDDTRIAVKTLRVTGAQVYAEAALVATSGFTGPGELSLSQLRALAERIAERYHRDGYLLAQAYLPAQDIKDGVVTIRVLEGHYGKIDIRNASKLASGPIAAALADLHSGDLIRSAPLESDLLRMSDLPGVTIKSTLTPGSTPGTADLIVDVTPANLISGSVDADNAGNRYTGANRVGATVNFNDPFGLGDLFSLRVLTSGSGLNYGRALYQVPVGRARVGVAASVLHYKLGEEFEPLQANGNARVATLFANYPLLRSRDTNLNVQVGFDAKTFEDKIDSTGARSDKHAQVLTTNLYGDHRDSFGGAGVSTGSLTLSSGNLDIRTPEALLVDAATAQTNGHFSKLGVTLTRTQAITPTVSLYGALSGQVSSKNLDISEKMELGGMNGVRAYPEGEAFADQGVLLNLEARYLVPHPIMGTDTQLQLVAFADTGSVTVNKNPWSDGVNHRTLSAAGVGANFYAVNNFTVRVIYARKLGSEMATSAPDRSGRFWIQGVKYF